MQTHNDIESIYKAIEEEVKNVLQIEAIKIQKAMTDYIDKEIYGSYEPLVYERINQFKESAIIKPVENIGGEWYIEIYIPDTVHDSSNWDGSQRTLSEIADWFASGEAFGRNGVKYDVIGNTEELYVKTGLALKDIVNYLSAKFDIIN